MRSFIRHPSDIPIEYMVENQHDSQPDKLRDVSFGGLSFQTDHALAVDTPIHIRIDTVKPPFEADGVVVWCQPSGQRFLIGIEFTHKEDVFLARMVEQVCHIEQYRKEVLLNEGRELTSQEAAREWIHKYAEIFPNPEQG
ncbi:MAG: PilZ domain-containing protein [Gammaproteobacteria bacterium]|nr:PilZ domain-containing protein [Gammaproteobacteria bacterium]